jgi:hypothetical protein
VLFTAYCGYVNYLIVILFIRVVFLLLVIVLIRVILIMDQGVLLITVKIFNLNFFGDFELLLNI